MLFDTHAHLDDERFEGALDGVLDRMQQAGVALVTCVGADMPSSRRAIALSEKRDCIYAACGVHPHEAAGFTQQDLDALTAMMAHPRVRAWGEIGLDYYYDTSPRPDQRRVFRQQLDAAAQLQKPVILHIREAHGEALEMLRQTPNLPPCVVHCFSGSVETMREYVRLGCMISFTGSVTFKNAEKLREVARQTPLDRLMVETDAPYLAPVPMRGHRNESAYVVHVAKLLAQLRQEDYDAFCAAVFENSCRFYQIRAESSAI